MANRGRPKKAGNYFNSTNKTKFTEPIKSKGIVDDFAVREHIDTREGSIQKIPVADKDISNKEYVDNTLMFSYTTTMENFAIGNPKYVGIAVPGTSKSAVGWQIRKFTYGGGTLTEIQFADGDTGFNKVWDDRETGGYDYK